MSVPSTIRFSTDPHSGHAQGAQGPTLFGNRMELTVHGDRAKAMQDWRELEARVASDSISCGWEWTTGWIRHFGGEVPHQIVVARELGIVRGMCLLTYPEESIGPFAVRTVHLGTAGEKDRDSLCIEYNRLLVEELYRKPMAFSLLKYLREDPSWDVLRFEGLAQEEAQVLIEAEPDFKLTMKESPYCDLLPSDEPLLARLGNSTRSNLKRKLKQWGEIKVEWAEEPGRADEIYEQLIRLHQARWEAEGMPGSFSSRHFREFHREMIQTLLGVKRVSLVRVSAEEGVIGCVLSYIERGTLLFYQMGANQELAKGSPGMIAIYSTMEEAARRGYQRFDFLAGEGEHKRRLSTGANQLVWADYQRSNLKMSTIENLKQAKRLLIGG
jgi:CelD/BcsL family acetyltransferase involved in cellulose biosynthesis